MTEAKRPAPTLEEAWAKLDPEMRQRHEEALAATDWERLWALQPQPLFSPDASFEELPEEIFRQCCQFKSCGATHLVKRKSAMLVGDGAVVVYCYVRSSNEEGYFAAESVEELIEQLNDPQYWPNGH